MLVRVGPTNDKEHGGQVGILKDEQGRPNNLNVSDFESAWNSTYMKNVRKQMLAGEQPPSCIKVLQRRSRRTQLKTYVGNCILELNELTLTKYLLIHKQMAEVPPQLSIH